VRGPTAIVLLVILVAAVPSSRRLSERIALNLAIVFGAAPLLWWFPWPAALAGVRASVVLGILGAVVVAGLVWSPGSRARVLPLVSLADLAPLGAAIVSLWLFRPFFAYASGLASVSLLKQGFGNDNVAHFDMFEMIRKWHVTGPFWPASPDGSPYAYVPYPQHFHVLAVMFADLWGGPARGSLDHETGLYGVATALLLTSAFVAVVAAVASIRGISRRVGLVLVAAMACLSFLLLGFGATSLYLGFPGYLLAIFGALLGIALALGGRSSLPRLAAVAATVVLVAHTWSLLTAFPAVALLYVVVRLPLREYRRRAHGAIVPAVILAITVLSVAFAAYLVYRATLGTGSPEAALATAGAEVEAPIWIPAVIAGLLLVLSVGYVAARGGTARASALRWPSALLASVALVALAEGAVLVVSQLLRAGELSYFQFKYSNAAGLVLVVLLVIQACFWVVRLVPPVGSRSTRIGRLAAAGAMSIALLLVSTFPVADDLLLTTGRLPGVDFRTYVELAAHNPPARVPRIVSAARVMEGLPCARPVYVAPFANDAQMGVADQWAMSFATEWSEAASPVLSRLYRVKSGRALSQLDSLVDGVLRDHPDRCVVVDPTIAARLRSEPSYPYAERTFTWG
jgi:heme/copper-type cytochrome/quinol oxidase subunit 3